MFRQLGLGRSKSALVSKSEMNILQAGGDPSSESLDALDKALGLGGGPSEGGGPSSSRALNKAKVDPFATKVF